MSFSGIHNPKVAAELIAEFRKKYSTKTCMAPCADHSGAIVSAHTLSAQAVLRKLSTDGHVYAAGQKVHFTPEQHPIQIKRLGIKDVSVFYGFCAKHDAELFSCLENEIFCFTRKQLFMLAYRAAAREYYLKRKQAESALPNPEKIKEMHGIDGELVFSEAALLVQAAALQGAEDIEKFKGKLDKYLQKESWDRLVTHAVLFPQMPSIAASFVFQPFHDMNGRQLQDFENLDAEMSQLAITVMPTDQGGAAIFSWLDSANSAPRRFFDSVVEANNLTSAILHAAIDNGENVAFEHDWWESLGEDKEKYIVSRIRLFNTADSSLNNSRPDDSAPYLGDWGAHSVVQF